MVKTYELETEMMYRWQNLVEALGFSRFRAGIHWPGIALSYGEKHRHYHNFTHIKSLLDMFANVTAMRTMTADDAHAIQLAIWFHDIVYDTKANDNEEKSADQARFILKELQLPLLMRARVVHMIHLTKHTPLPSKVEPTWADKFFLDLDLSILGADPATFAKYDEDIAKEYSWVPKEIYNAKRVEVLDGFLKRDRIFSDPEMHRLFEQQARTNLQTTIQNAQVKP